MLLSIITVAFRNLEGIVKTHASLAHLAQAGDISFEWIVVDGGSSDGTSAFLEGFSGEHRLRFVSEPDKGIYDAMNKGIAMARGRFALVPQLRGYFACRCGSFYPPAKNAER